MWTGFHWENHVKFPTKAYPVTFPSIFAKHKFFKWPGTNYFTYIPKVWSPWELWGMVNICEGSLFTELSDHITSLPSPPSSTYGSAFWKNLASAHWGKFWVKHRCQETFLCDFILHERDYSCLWAASVLTADLTREKGEGPEFSGSLQAPISTLFCLSKATLSAAKVSFSLKINVEF